MAVTVPTKPITDDADQCEGDKNKQKDIVVIGLPEMCEVEYLTHGRRGEGSASLMSPEVGHSGRERYRVWAWRRGGIWDAGGSCRG
jgi:hypothetical protein